MCAAAIASLLADDGTAGSAVVLSKDAKVFENIRSRQAEEKLRREIIAVCLGSRVYAYGSHICPLIIRKLHQLQGNSVV